MNFDNENTPVGRAEARAEAPLMAAARLLADRNVYGLVWLDRDLYVTARYGLLVDFIEIGVPVTESLISLVGLEETLAALPHNRDVSDTVVELPSIAIIDSNGPKPRLNLTVFWSEANDQYLVLFSRPGSQAGLEQDLSRQMRARLMAEAAVVEASKQLARANRDLEIANRDLEDYASIISHDLKAPLRHLRYLADDIEVAVQQNNPKAAEAHLDALRAQSTRMSTMMTALLDYAAIGQKADAAEDVDTLALAGSIRTSLSGGESHTHTIAIAGDWPVCTTLRAPLDLILRNLIDNALKHHDTAHAHVTVTAKRLADALMIKVADDGPGIRIEHQDAVLLPFRTLSCANEATTTGAPERTKAAEPSTGMGLALVVRTLETVGGTLTIESNPDLRRGTTVLVRWPLT